MIPQQLWLFGSALLLTLTDAFDLVSQDYDRRPEREPLGPCLRCGKGGGPFSGDKFLCNACLDRVVIGFREGK